MIHEKPNGKTEKNVKLFHVLVVNIFMELRNADYRTSRCPGPACGRSSRDRTAGRHGARNVAARHHQQPVGQVERCSSHRLRRLRRWSQSHRGRQPHRYSNHTVNHRKESVK